MQVPLDDLQEHPLNSEIYGDEAAQDDLVESIAETGIVSPLIANSQNGRIVSGNTRFRAARQIGLETVPVVYKSLSEADEHLHVVTGNVARSKTNLQRVREYQILLAGFKKQAKEGGAKSKAGKAGAKSRQKAADIVGESPATLQKGVAVVKAIETLHKNGDDSGAKRLAEILNRRRGFDPAEQEAIKMGLIAAPKKKAKSTEPDKAEPTCTNTTSDQQSDGSEASAAANEEQPSKEQSEATPVSNLALLLRQATPLLADAAKWSDQEKEQIGSLFAKFAAAMALAGIKPN